MTGGDAFLKAANHNVVIAAAYAYSIAGYSTIPLTGKKCPIKWEAYQQRRADVMQIKQWEQKYLLRNIGIVCGAVSNNLVVIDLDSQDAVALYERTFPALLKTFAVRTGSGHGKHYYYHVDQLPPTIRLMGLIRDIRGNIELRANGCYVVAPPSIHPDTGYKYLIANALPVMTLPSMENVTAWLNQFRPKAEITRAHKAEDKAAIKNSGRYGLGALYSEARRLRSITEGDRNNHLNLSAFRMGQLVNKGLLTEADVERELLAAAVATGQNERESLATIRSGLLGAKKKPNHRDSA
jgi:hypothetical protein